MHKINISHKQILYDKVDDAIKNDINNIEQLIQESLFLRTRNFTKKVKIPQQFSNFTYSERRCLSFNVNYACSDGSMYLLYYGTFGFNYNHAIYFDICTYEYIYELSEGGYEKRIHFVTVDWKEMYNHVINFMTPLLK